MRAPATTSSPPHRCAFTLPEVLVIIGILAVFAGGAVLMMAGTMRSSEQVKLKNDLRTVNAAVRSFLANGGDLEGLTTGEEILERVKTRAADGQIQEHVGHRGGFLDPRTVGVTQDTAESETAQPRILWNVSTKRFVLKYGGAKGFKRFALDESLAGKEEVGHERHTRIAYASKGDDQWIWDYEDFTTSSRGSDGTDTSAPTVSSYSGDSSPPPLQLDPPSVSVPGNRYDIFDYVEFKVHLTNPNPTGSSEMIYSTETGVWKRYTEAIAIIPGVSLRTRAFPVDPRRWAQSNVTEDDYSSTPVKLEIGLEFNGTEYNYVNLGGALEPGNYALTDLIPPGIASLTNAHDIPTEFQNSELLALRARKSTTLDSGFVQINAAFSDGLPDQMLHVWLDDWAADGTVEVKVYAKSLNSDFFTSSDPVSKTLIGTQIALREPIIELSAQSSTSSTTTTTIHEATLKLVTDYADMPLGSRIFYTKDGTDPGIGGDGEPLSGEQYIEPFQITSDQKIMARVYPPMLYRQWFIPSAPAGEAADPAEFFDVVLGDDVLFVIDASGSMNARFSNAKRFDRVVLETIEAIDQMKETQRFALITFNGGLHWSDGSNDLKPATPENKQSVKDALTSMHAQGATNYEVGLKYGLELATQPKQIIFLSDGQPNQQNYSDELDSLVGLGVSIDTIGIGNLHSQPPLQQMATQSGGSYRFVSEPGSAGTLSAPRFSVSGNEFDYHQFPITLALTSDDLGTVPSTIIRYSINGGLHQIYSTPLEIGYATTVEAYADSTDPSWAPSSPVGETYSVKNYDALKPTIALSADTFTDAETEITVTMTDNNPDGLAKVIYWFGTQAESQASEYTGAFILSAADWNTYASDSMKDVKIYTRAVGAAGFVNPSGTNDTKIENKTTAFITRFNATPLDRPVFNPGGSEFVYTSFPLQVAIANPNSGIGSLEVSIDGGAFEAYTGPLTATYETEIRAVVRAPDSGLIIYRDSSMESRQYAANPVNFLPVHITVSAKEFDENVKTISVTINDPNPASLSRLVYWFDGQDPLVDGIAYTGPFDLTVAEWESYLKPGDSKAKLHSMALPLPGTESFVKASKEAKVDLENSN